ncbi:FkbM family methyltransferase [Tannerella serpentiformis]|jgi:methyltransferase, fkbM family|uniref:FkbM family methyltransferase n=1 Tax=Tannerella serpentiformis TaxID=712710 RepID=UPI00084096C8|nr:FkbM family methyltransferase [Tannerella serpentiformis]AOH41501.1 FkbM family methyltransferase [Tannerella serpentiformis]AVV53218.1 FkbM family methyltransferase [Tannerella serpentiformis]
MKILNAIYRFLQARQIFVNDVLRFLSKIDSPIILEAGAADGVDTLRFAKLLSSQGVIYAFEPVLQNFERLKDLVKEQHNVHTFRMALGDHDGK